jgi:hypothetical protein
MCGTRLARNGLRGHPCANPLVRSKASKVPSGLQHQQLLLAEQSMSKSGSNRQNCLWISSMERQASRKTALNMLIMLRRRRALVGESEFKCRSRSAIVVCMMKSTPLGMPTPNCPWGSKCLALDCYGEGCSYSLYCASNVERPFFF